MLGLYFTLFSGVSSHGLVTSFGNDAQGHTVPREPDAVFRMDSGIYNEAGLRCASPYFNDVSQRLIKGCIDSDLWQQGTSLTNGYKSLQDATEDEGYCLGWSSGGFMRSPITSYAPAQFWGQQILPEFCAGQQITKTTVLTAYHGGTHWVDMIPQNDAQYANLPICSNGRDTPFVADMDDYVVPCYWPDANPVSSRGTIILHKPRLVANDAAAEYYDTNGNPTSADIPIGGKAVVKYTFTLPQGVDYEAGPITFRWMWMCGVNVATGEVNWQGQGEMWHNCIDARIASSCGAPAPDTTVVPGPTTSAPDTTAAPDTTGDNAERDCDYCFAECIARCGEQWWVSELDLQCWGSPRYFTCGCRDGSRPSIPGCRCLSSSCPNNDEVDPRTTAQRKTTAVPETTPSPETTAETTTASATTLDDNQLRWGSRFTEYVSDDTCEAICRVNNPVCCIGSESGCYSFQLCHADGPAPVSFLI